MSRLIPGSLPLSEPCGCCKGKGTVQLSQTIVWANKPVEHIPAKTIECLWCEKGLMSPEELAFFKKLA